MTESDPVRLRDAGSDAASDLRRALEEASDVPSERLARVAERLGSGGPPGSGGSGPSPAPSPLRAIGITATAAVVALGVGLGAWQAFRAPTEHVTPPASVAVTTTHPALPALAPAPTAPAPPPTTTALTNEQHDTAPAPTPSAAEPESEAQLLLRARRALSASPPRTMALVREHARRFPEGDLVEEREALRIEALVATGRAAEARSTHAQFQARFPGSAHLEHLSQLISTQRP